MLHPHPALSPVPTDRAPATILEQRESESAWRQLLVQGVLAVLMPTDELGNGCLRALVAEMFAEMILGNAISGKACEGWLLWELITRVAEVLQTTDAKGNTPQSDVTGTEQPRTRLERYGLLSPHAENALMPEDGLNASQRHRSSPFMLISTVFWTFVQYGFLAFTALRVVTLSLATSSSLPSRSVMGDFPAVERLSESYALQADPAASKRPLGVKRPIVSMKIWSFAAQLAELDVRMPWLLGFTSFLHHGALTGPCKVGETDGVLDR